METKTLFEELVTSDLNSVAYHLAFAYITGYRMGGGDPTEEFAQNIYEQYITALNEKSPAYIGKVD